MFYRDGICINIHILAWSIIISLGFAFWLYRDTDLIKYLNFSRESSKFLLFEQYEDDLKLRKETLTDIFDDEIDLIWLSVVQDEPDGHVKLQLYSRLLAANPDREKSYKEIASIIDSAPEEYPIKEKHHYLMALKAITGIHDVLLDKYGLLITADNQ